MENQWLMFILPGIFVIVCFIVVRVTDKERESKKKK